jgi:uncharacterized integral membrane protein
LLVLAIFLLSNRQTTGLSFWPFGVFGSAPVGGVVIAALAIGFVLGLGAHLPKRLAASRRAKRAEQRVADIENRFAPPAALSGQDDRATIRP